MTDWDLDVAAVMRQKDHVIDTVQRQSRISTSHASEKSRGHRHPYRWLYQPHPFSGVIPGGAGALRENRQYLGDLFHGGTMTFCAHVARRDCIGRRARRFRTSALPGGRATLISPNTLLSGSNDLLVDGDWTALPEKPCGEKDNADCGLDVGSAVSTRHRLASGRHGSARAGSTHAQAPARQRAASALSVNLARAKSCLPSRPALDTRHHTTTTCLEGNSATQSTSSAACLGRASSGCEAAHVAGESRCGRDTYITGLACAAARLIGLSLHQHRKHISGKWRETRKGLGTALPFHRAFLSPLSARSVQRSVPTTPVLSKGSWLCCRGFYPAPGGGSLHGAWAMCCCCCL
ncbi:hypothetical protein Bbelb_311430 [Branchiostoma belcheri]|nr:hypothetical protein Bbelb_311430 [Branchiostoma belcheri]